MLDLISVNLAMCVVDMVSIGLVGWFHIREPICTRKVIHQVGLLPVLVIHCNYGFPMSEFTEHCTSKHTSYLSILVHRRIIEVYKK